MRTSLSIVGVGPGAPDLLTLRALYAIQSADSIAYFCGRHKPGQAIKIIQGYLNEKQVTIPLIYPYTTEIPSQTERYRHAMRVFYDQCAQTLYEHISQHHMTALICEGDPLLYGSAMYIMDRLQGKIAMHVVPGIMSMNGAWCQAALPMVHGHESLVVCNGTADEKSLYRSTERGDAIVLMKVGKNLEKIRRVLQDVGRYDEAVYIERGTQKDGRIMKLKDFHEDAPYFSLILLPGRKSKRL